MSGTAANLGVAEIADWFPEVTIVLGHGGLATEQDDAYRTAGSAALAAGPTSSSRSRLWHRAPTQVGRPRACGHGCWAPSTPSARSGRCWPPTLADPPAARELRRTCQRLPLDHRRLPPTECAAVLPALRPASTASLLRGVKPNLLAPGRRGMARSCSSIVPQRSTSRPKSTLKLCCRRAAAALIRDLLHRRDEAKASRISSSMSWPISACRPARARATSSWPPDVARHLAIAPQPTAGILEKHCPPYD